MGRTVVKKGKGRALAIAPLSN